MTKKSDPYKLKKMEPDPVSFAKFNGGVIVRCDGVAVGISNTYLGVVLEDGSKVYFKRKNGWGIGKSKFWRLSIHERDKYVHSDQPSGTSFRFKSV